MVFLHCLSVRGAVGVRSRPPPDVGLNGSATPAHHERIHAPDHGARILLSCTRGSARICVVECVDARWVSIAGFQEWVGEQNGCKLSDGQLERR